VLLPAVEVTPSPQSRHVAATDAPTVSEYLPAAQLVHVVEVEAPVAVEYLPALQSVHASEPVVVLYFPAPHAVHVPPSGPEKPATHTQSVAASLPVADCELEGQL
jgi:hypothetical protein